jgi:GABA(A) receptor-associated protein
MQEESLDERRRQSNRLRSKFRDRVPVIANAANERTVAACGEGTPKSKYLVPNDLSFGEFMYIIRKRIKVDEKQALVGFVNSLLPPNAKSMSELYSESSSEDGFLYITYSLENTFGSTACKQQNPE